MATMTGKDQLELYSEKLRQVYMDTFYRPTRENDTRFAELLNGMSEPFGGPLFDVEITQSMVKKWRHDIGLVAFRKGATPEPEPELWPTQTVSVGAYDLMTERDCLRLICATLGEIRDALKR